MILSFHQKEIVSNYKEKNHQTLKGLTGEVNNNDHLVTMDCSHWGTLELWIFTSLMTSVLLLSVANLNIFVETRLNNNLFIIVSFQKHAHNCW